MSQSRRLIVHFGNEEHTTGHHLVEALGQRGVEVTVRGRGHRTQDGPLPSGVPLLWIESGNASFPTAGDLARRPSAAWLIDTHRGYEWRAPFASAFDLCFVAQRSAVDHLAATGLAAVWLPLASPGHSPGYVPAHRPVPASFVGNVLAGTRRARILDAVTTPGVVKRNAGYLTPREMIVWYEQSVVVVNIPLASDLNMRLFEAAGAGAYVVTGPMDGLAEILPQSTITVVESDDPGAWVTAISEALANDQTADRAARAESIVHSRHLYTHRVQVVLERLARLEQRPIPEPARRESLLQAAIACHAAKDAWRISTPSLRGRAAVSVRLARTAARSVFGRAGRSLRPGAAG